MKKLLAGSLALAIFALAGCDTNRTTTDSDPVERAEDVNEERLPDRAEEMSTFLVEAASGGMMEVELGKLASQKASDPEVKNFGQMMATDHSKANEELKRVAASKDVALPATMGEKHREHYNELEKLSGTEFDKKYMDLMVEDHEEDVRKFRKAAEDLEDPDVKSFAANTLPTLQQHLDMAKKIDERLDNKK